MRHRTTGAAGLVIGQEQGPLKDPGRTVAKPRKPDTGTSTGTTGTDTDLPKIPSQYKKDKIDPATWPTSRATSTW